MFGAIDIVDQLRRDYPPGPPQHVLRKAADEIVRLRGEGHNAMKSTGDKPLSTQEIDDRLKSIAAKATDEALAQLGRHGLRIGAIVHSILYSRNQGIFRITRITFGTTDNAGIWFYGNKLRRDGTFGSHEHSISGSDGLTARTLGQEAA